MIRQPIYRYYWFGTCLRFLQDVQENMGVHGDGKVLYNLEKIKQFLSELDLTVSTRVAKPLFGILDELKKSPQSALLTGDQARMLHKETETLRKTLDAELMEVEAFRTTPKMLNLKKLIDDVSGLFRPDVFFALPKLARYDFSEAGKCIAFNRPTAAAFHILRGTEAVLRFFYEHIIQYKRIKSRNWGPIIDDLKTRKKMRKYSILLNHLDNIRDAFRNPTQHPEKIYDIHEAQDLWSLCVEVVNRMIRILKNEKRI